MLQLLEKVENRFSNEYETVNVDGQKCFISQSGMVFYFLILNQFKSLIVEYANNIDDACRGIFEDGDQFDIEEPFDDLISGIRREVLIEAY